MKPLWNWSQQPTPHTRHTQCSSAALCLRKRSLIEGPPPPPPPPQKAHNHFHIFFHSGLKGVEAHWKWMHNNQEETFSSSFSLTVHFLKQVLILFSPPSLFEICEIVCGVPFSLSLFSFYVCKELRKHLGTHTPAEKKTQQRLFFAITYLLARENVLSSLG